MTDTIFGVHAARVTEHAGTPERFARVTLSGIAEPGDEEMATLLRNHTAADVLMALLTTEPQSIVALGHLSEEVALAAHRRWAPRVNAANPLRALEAANAVDAVLLTPEDAEWPTRINSLPAPPIALWVRGDVSLLNADRQVAIIGARAATGYGEHVTTDFAATIAGHGAVVVSGGAYGIDGAAHRAALAAQGKTVAYLAGGVDGLYPSGHDAMLKRVIEHGAVVSEVPPGTPPTRWRFLMRNRLIAAVSNVVLVVEAGFRSGALNTVEHARKLNIPVCAVPGPITSAASAGTHQLIKEGAHCVTSAGEVLNFFAGHLINNTKEN